jgi:hypothetical protein
MDALANWVNYAREAATSQPPCHTSRFLHPWHVPAAVDPFHS